MDTMKKNFIWNLIGTGLNSFTSLFLLIFIVKINGVVDSGIFSIAFANACVFYVIGTYSGRVFQVTESNNKIKDIDYIYQKLFTCILMLLLIIIFTLVRGYNAYKISIFIILGLYKALEAFADGLYGVLQKNERLDLVGKSYFIKALLTNGVFLVVDLLTHNLLISSLCIVAIWSLLLIYDYINVKKFVKNTKFNKNNIIHIFKSGFIIFLITFIGIYMVNSSKYAIDFFLDETAQTIFGIIVMPATVIALFGQFFLHPYLAEIAKLNKEKKYKELVKIKNKIMLLILGFGVLCVIGAFLLGPEVLGILYGIDLTKYRVPLCVILMAATLYNIGGTYSSLLTTIRKKFIQLVIYIIVGLVTIVSSILLTKYLGFNGAVASYLITMTIFFILYFIFTYFTFERGVMK